MVAIAKEKPEMSAGQPAASDLDAITREVLRAVKGNEVVWKAAPESDSGEQSGIWRGLAYVRVGSKVRREWEARWPSSVAIPAWDLVGRVQIGQGGCWEWVLVKVFWHPDELMAGSPPQEPEALQTIEWIFEQAKRTSRAPAEADWVGAGFEVATLVAIRAYLSSMGACGRMVFLCVGGDEWLAPIEEAKARFGIKPGTAVSNRLKWLVLGQ